MKLQYKTMQNYMQMYTITLTEMRSGEELEEERKKEEVNLAHERHEKQAAAMQRYSISNILGKGYHTYG